MVKPRTANSLLLATMLVAVSFLIGGLAFEIRAQQPSTVDASERERGLKLYEQGDTKGSIKALRAAVKQNQADAEAWYHLGVALYRDDNIKEAQKAFQKTVKLQPNDAAAHTAYAFTLVQTNKLKEAKRAAERALTLNQQDANAHYILGAAYFREGEILQAKKEADAALKIDPELPSALLLKTQALISMYFYEAPIPNKAARSSEIANPIRLGLKEAAESLEKYLKLKPDANNAKLWREQLETLQIYAEEASAPEQPLAERAIFSSKELTSRAHILKWPQPQYTEAARQAQVRGTIVLRAIFAADGKVKRILVVKALSHGLTEQAVNAARSIRFTPAVKDGRQVSQYIQIEYNFNIY